MFCNCVEASFEIKLSFKSSECSFVEYFVPVLSCDSLNGLFPVQTCIGC